MNANGNNGFEFTSTLTKKETIATLIYFPFHLILVPMILGIMLSSGKISETDANIMCYAVGLMYFLIVDVKYLRREFDPLCDNILGCLWQVVLCYAIMMAINMIVSGTITGIEYIFSGNEVLTENQNNDAIVDMAGREMGKTKAIAVFLAPIVEEVLFRGGLFCTIHKKNRLLAYAVSMLAFSVYHVWGYAAADPTYWIYIIQYIPASYVLCRCYEKTNSIWASIMLHMCVNNIALQVLTAAEELL